jgi:uncharacterized protein YydD (DUF2326 family)
MTDNEIKQALPFLAKYCKDEYNDIRVDEVLLGASDLINRLQADKEALIAGQKTLQKALAEKIAEVERLKTLAELGNMRANDYRVMRDRALKAEAEVKKLKDSRDRWKRNAQAFDEASRETEKELEALYEEIERLKNDRLCAKKRQKVV